MLLTLCPNCKAQFKVTPDQLKVRQGRVMCGRCRHVFNAFQSLERIDSAFLPQIEAPRVTDVIQDLAALKAARVADPPPEPEVLAHPETVEPTSMEEPAVLNAMQIRPADEFQPRDPASEQPTVADATASPYRHVDTLSADELDFGEEVRRPHRGWRLGAAFLVLSMAVQATYFYRSSLVSAYPEIRAYFSAACEWLACTLPWNRDENALKVESSDLIEEIGKPGSFLLTATISNRAKTMQDFPSIELTLTDTNNQTLTRRVLQPKDYLGRPVQRDEGMAPGTETQLNLRLDAKNSRAAGYHLLLFYP